MNLKKIDALLIQKAINSAKLHGDEYNHFRYSQMEGKKITPAERRDMNIYLFGAMWDRATVDMLGALP